jgi:hypothetical protein
MKAALCRYQTPCQLALTAGLIVPRLRHSGTGSPAAIFARIAAIDLLIARNRLQ